MIRRFATPATAMLGGFSQSVSFSTTSALRIRSSKIARDAEAIHRQPTDKTVDQKKGAEDANQKGSANTPAPSECYHTRHSEHGMYRVWVPGRGYYWTDAPPYYYRPITIFRPLPFTPAGFLARMFFWMMFIPFFLLTIQFLAVYSWVLRARWHRWRQIQEWERVRSDMRPVAIDDGTPAATVEQASTHDVTTQRLTVPIQEQSEQQFSDYSKTTESPKDPTQ